MKTYKNLYSHMLEHDNIVSCIMKASEEKRHRPDVKRIIDDVDTHADRVKELFENGEIDFTNYTVATINSSSDKKERLIAKPRFKYDQIGHHVVMSQFMPIVSKSLYEHVYSTVPDRSPQKDARRFLKRWIDSYGKKRFYVLKCDIRHFYDSVDHELLKERIARVIKDKDYLEVINKLIDAYEPGIPKGFYSSQWFANFLLNPLDHYIKEDLGIKHYMRYMDDMVLLCPNKRKLRKIKIAIEEYLNVRLNLKFKHNWQIYRFVDKDDKNGRDIDFMGFRFFRNKITRRKSGLQKMRRKAHRLERKRREYQAGIGQGMTIYDCRSMMSDIGWTTYTDTYSYYERYINPYISRRQLRQRISRFDKTKAKIEKLKSSKC